MSRTHSPSTPSRLRQNNAATKSDLAIRKLSCDPRMQRKMYKDTLEGIGVDFDKQVTAIDLRNMETDTAINKVKETLTQMGT